MQIRWDKESAFLEKHCYLYGSLKKLYACTQQLLITMRDVMVIHSQSVHSCYSFHRGVYGNDNYLGRHHSQQRSVLLQHLKNLTFSDSRHRHTQSLASRPTFTLNCSYWHLLRWDGGLHNLNLSCTFPDG